MRFLHFFLFLFLFFLFPKEAFASNFSLGYDVKYQIQESEKATVTYRVSLTNTTSDYYATSYKVTLGFENIDNVRASDSDGVITPDVAKSDDGYTINLPFNKRVVGLGNTLTFTLSFDTKDIVQKHGKIWEVNVPGTSEQENFTQYNVHVKVPESLGRPTYAKPSLSDTNLDFTKEQLGKSGISLAFGDKQNYAFNLLYHLKNSNVFPIRTEIAIPPTTNYQEVLIENITPKPSNVYRDVDGNWLAQYSLLPTQKIDITVLGKVQVSLYPKIEPVFRDTLANFTRQKPYWETNQEMQKLAKSLKTPEAIYNYIVGTLQYDFSRVTSGKPRLGALETFKNPSSAVCLEFSDLFVALARAAGIPARELDGFAYTDNQKQRPLSLVKDVLHAWPEYYDTSLQTWVMVDPTWDNTTGGVDYFHTLDFDHFAFTIKGDDSAYPVPAGGYKLPGNPGTKDVQVIFADDFVRPSPNIQIETHIPSVFTAGFDQKGFILVRNTGTGILLPATLTISSPLAVPLIEKIQVNTLPPYGYQKIPVSFFKTPFLTNRETQVTIRVADKTVFQQIHILPIFLTMWGVVGGIFLAIIFTVFILIFTARIRRLPFLQ